MHKFSPILLKLIFPQINADYGGLEGLCAKLQTDPLNGLPNSSAELERRRRAFGRNEIPPVPAKSFLRLAWEALQDVTLIILLIAAIVSLALSFYKPKKDTFGQSKLMNSTGPPSMDTGRNEAINEQHAGWIEGAAILIAVSFLEFLQFCTF